MKKYVFLIKRATKNEVEIEAENKNEAFKKVMQFITEDGENNVNNIDIDKEIISIPYTKKMKMGNWKQNHIKGIKN